MEEKLKSTKYEGIEIGKIDHFYNKISVAVVKLKESLKKGDRVKIYDKQGNVILEQEVRSMQIEGKDVDVADKGEHIGIKLDAPVREGYLIYKQ
jgi:putative protease